MASSIERTFERPLAGKNGFSHTLALSPLTVLPCTPLEQIDAAEAAGFDAVDLRLVKVLDTDIDVMADPHLRRAILNRLAQSSMKVLGIEVIRVGPSTVIESFLPILEFGNALGARYMTVTAPAKAEYAPEDESLTVQKLSSLCNLAATYKIQPMLEFMAFRGIATIEDAVRVVSRVDHPNMGICLDALHLYRSGGTAASVSKVDPKMLSCLQLCDGPLIAPADLMREARHERLYPGEGQLPLRELLQSVPRDLPISLEAPNASYAGLSVEERAQKIASCARNLLS